MIQLDQRKKIIIMISLAVLIIVVAILFIVKNSQNNKIIANPGPGNTTETKRQPREMTQDEKINVVGIDSNTEAEVLNDQDGLYIYRIKK